VFNVLYNLLYWLLTEIAIEFAVGFFRDYKQLVHGVDMDAEAGIYTVLLTVLSVSVPQPPNTLYVKLQCICTWLCNLVIWLLQDASCFANIVLVIVCFLGTSSAFNPRLCVICYVCTLYFSLCVKPFLL